MKLTLFEVFIFLTLGSFCSCQLGQAPEVNSNTNNIPVVTFQVRIHIRIDIYWTDPIFVSLSVYLGRWIHNYRVLGILQWNYHGMQKNSVDFWQTMFFRKTWSPLPSVLDCSCFMNGPACISSPMLLSKIEILRHNVSDKSYFVVPLNCEKYLQNIILGVKPSDFVRKEPSIAAGTEPCQHFTNGGNNWWQQWYEIIWLWLF